MTKILFGIIPKNIHSINTVLRKFVKQSFKFWKRINHSEQGQVNEMGRLLSGPSVRNLQLLSHYSTCAEAKHILGVLC